MVVEVAAALRTQHGREQGGACGRLRRRHPPALPRRLSFTASVGRHIPGWSCRHVAGSRVAHGRAKRTRAERLRVPSCPFQRQKRLAQAPMSFIFNQSKILGTIDRIPCIPNTGCPKCLSTVWIQCVSIFFRKCVNIVRIFIETVLSTSRTRGTNPQIG